MIVIVTLQCSGAQRLTFFPTSPSCRSSLIGQAQAMISTHFHPTRGTVCHEHIITHQYMGDMGSTRREMPCSTPLSPLLWAACESGFAKYKPPTCSTPDVRMESGDSLEKIKNQRQETTEKAGKTEELVSKNRIGSKAKSSRSVARF